MSDPAAESYFVRLARLERLLADAPLPGLTQDNIAAATGWTLRATNDLLCDMMGRIKSGKFREGRDTLVKYSLKSKDTK